MGCWHEKLLQTQLLLPKPSLIIAQAFVKGMFNSIAKMREAIKKQKRYVIFLGSPLLIIYYE